MGNSIAAASLAGTVNLDADALLVKTEHICPLQEELQELSPSRESVQALRDSFLADAGKMPPWM